MCVCVCDVVVYVHMCAPVCPVFVCVCQVDCGHTHLVVEMLHCGEGEFGKQGLAYNETTTGNDAPAAPGELYNLNRLPIA